MSTPAFTKGLGVDCVNGVSVGDGVTKAGLAAKEGLADGRVGVAVGACDVQAAAVTIKPSAITARRNMGADACWRASDTFRFVMTFEL